TVRAGGPFEPGPFELVPESGNNAPCKPLFLLAAVHHGRQIPTRIKTRWVMPWVMPGFLLPACPLPMRTECGQHAERYETVSKRFRPTAASALRAPAGLIAA